MGLRRGTHGRSARHEAEAPNDQLLLQACRNGDTEAFAALFRRYHHTVVQIAAATSGSVDPEDLAAESFTRIWAAIREGRGPTQSFLPYARTVVRNVAVSWAARALETPAEPEQLERVSSRSADSTTFADALAEHQLVSDAFATLPRRWQSVLWMTEVEGKRAAEVAAELGISPNAAAALSKRARDALGRAWLQAQVDTPGTSDECRWVLDHVGGHVRQALTPQQQARVRKHLESCEGCERATRRIAHLGSSLRLIALLAGGTAAGLAAWAAGGAAPAFAAGQQPGLLAASGGPPAHAGTAARNAVKQLVRQVATAPGAVVAGVAASAVVVAAVVVPGALSGSRVTESAVRPAAAINRAPQPLDPPLTKLPDGGPLIEAPAAHQEDVPIAGQQAALAAQPSRSNDQPRRDEPGAPDQSRNADDPTEPEPSRPGEPVDPPADAVDPGPGPLPVDPQPLPTDPPPEPTGPPPEPTGPPPEPADPQPLPTDPEPGPMDPEPDPSKPRPEPSDPECADRPGWPGWQEWLDWLDQKGWQPGHGWPGWPPTTPECPTLPTPPGTIDPVDPADPAGSPAPGASTEPSEPPAATEPADPTEIATPPSHPEPADPTELATPPSHPEPADPTELATPPSHPEPADPTDPLPEPDQPSASADPLSPKDPAPPAPEAPPAGPDDLFRPDSHTTA